MRKFFCRAGSMREFFNGWRRKVGCVALMVACWLMSLCLAQRLNYPGGVDAAGDDPGAQLFALAFPLTLLSTYLILWKPRAKLKNAVAELSQAGGS